MPMAAPDHYSGDTGGGHCCGLWNGLLVARVGKIQPMVATLILMVAGRGIAQLITNGQIVTIYYQPFFFIGNGFLFGVPFSLYIVVAVLTALLLLTRRTALGVFIEAVGVNPTASRFSGLRSRAIIFWVYAFCGLSAGVAGLIISSNVKSADGNNAGLLLELDAILAVTLGGTSLAGGRFSIVGSIIGALIIQTLTYTIYSVGVPPEVNLVVKALRRAGCTACCSRRVSVASLLQRWCDRRHRGGPAMTRGVSTGQARHLRAPRHRCVDFGAASLFRCSSAG